MYAKQGATGSNEDQKKKRKSATQVKSMVFEEKNAETCKINTALNYTKIENIKNLDFQFWASKR